MKGIIQDLYELMVRVNGYDTSGTSGQDVLIDTMYVIMSQLGESWYLI